MDFGLVASNRNEYVRGSRRADCFQHSPADISLAVSETGWSKFPDQQQDSAILVHAPPRLLGSTGAGKMCSCRSSAGLIPTESGSRVGAAPSSSAATSPYPPINCSYSAAQGIRWHNVRFDQRPIVANLMQPPGHAARNDGTGGVIPASHNRCQRYHCEQTVHRLAA